MRDLANLPDQIRRSDLVEAAQRLHWQQPDPAEVRRLFVLTMMWGSGTTNGRGPRNTQSALATANSIDTLIEVHSALQGGEIPRAYDLHRKLRGLGPSFHTKWLWLMGRVTGTTPQSLILDARVWATLSRLEWSSLMASGGDRRWGQRYVAYLRACELWARDAGVDAEDIEYTLFMDNQPPRADLKHR